MDTEPIAVALKFGFLAVLYLFLLWVARSALRELRTTSKGPAPEATGFHPIGPGGRAAATDVGRQRSANEDSFFSSPPLFAVADGMGGAKAGEVASRIAVESFAPGSRGDQSPEAYLRGIAEAANDKIHRLAQADSSRSGMG